MKKHILILSLSLCCGISVSAQVAVSGSNPFPTLPFAARMVLLDADKDNDLDVLYQAGNTSGVGWNYMQNNGNGTYTTIAASGTGTFSSGPFNGITFTGYGTMYAIDYDNDGDMDLLDQQNNSSRLLVNNGNSTYSVSGSNPFPTLPFAARMVFLDADKDGDRDVLYQASSISGVGWNYMQNNGNGTYTTTAAGGTGTFSSGPFNGITFTGYGTMYAIDYDNDGDVDLLDQQNNSSRLLVNSGGSTFSVSGSNPFPTLPFAARMVFVDADSDGDPDVLYQAGSTSGVGWNYMQNNGNGTYTTIAAGGTGTFSSGPFNGVTFTGYGTMYITDYDKDGDLDIVDQQNNSSRLLFQTNTPPRLLSSTPANGNTAVGTGVTIALNFSEAVSAGSGNIYIRRASDNSVFQTIAASGANVTGTGTATIHITHNVLAINTGYYLTFDVTAFRDAGAAAFGTLPAGSNYVQPITGFSFLAFTTGTALPLTLLSFTAQRQAEDVALSWAMADVKGISYFDVAYSDNGTDFLPAGRIYPQYEGQKAYSFLHKNAGNQTIYYRLQQLYTNGEACYSNTCKVNPSAAIPGVRVWPNPASGIVHVTFPAGVFEQLQLTDMAGRLLVTKVIQEEALEADYDMTGFKAGAYILLLGSKEARQSFQLQRQ